MPNGKQNGNPNATHEVNKDSWLKPSTYMRAIHARHAGEQSYLSIVNAHILANTILFATISLLATNLGIDDYAGKIISSVIALFGLALAYQTRLAFLIARGNNICWDEVIKEYERKRPIFPSPTNGGLYTLNSCVMTNGITCKASPISVIFHGNNGNIETAIKNRNEWRNGRIKRYPLIFTLVYILLIAFVWRHEIDDLFMSCCR